MATTATTVPAPGGTPGVGCTMGVPPGAGAVVAVVLTVSTSSFMCVHTNVRTCQNNNKNSIITHKHDHKHKRAQNTKTRKLALIARLASQTYRLPTPHHNGDLSIVGARGSYVTDFQAQNLRYDTSVLFQSWSSLNST